MPSSSEALVVQYHPKRVANQKYNRAPRESVQVDVKELDEIPSGVGNKKIWIGFGVGTVVAILITVGVVAPITIIGNQSSTSVNQTSSIGSTAISGSSSGSGTTVQSSIASSTTISSGSTASITTISSGSTASSTTVHSGSTASTTASAVTTVGTTTNAAGFSASGAVAAGTTQWYGYEQVVVACSVNLANMTIVITVQKTVNATYSGAYTTFWGGVMGQSYVETASQIIYTWTINSGQTIQASGSPYTIQAQFRLSGVYQTTSADTFVIIAATTSGATSTVSGHF